MVICCFHSDPDPDADRRLISDRRRRRLTTFVSLAYLFGWRLTQVLLMPSHADHLPSSLVICTPNTRRTQAKAVTSLRAAIQARSVRAQRVVVSRQPSKGQRSTSSVVRRTASSSNAGLRISAHQLIPQIVRVGHWQQPNE
ncbi:unnamed protein product [Soboliphyme baturini]|uniref:Uncharacterized protein n=1 Tax=Soboliphyme baturini TaxID=241478 RepID=A0A183I9I6_9BILA|nr:unnamed protein product [Soboliphyme baturini]